MKRKSEVKIRAYFLSDIHLESEQDSNFFILEKLLCRILQDRECTHLFLLGDIFDLWVAKHSYFTKRFADTLDLLNRIRARGVEIHYFEGNHDLDLEPYFKACGFVIHEEAWTFPIGDQILRLEHGDQMDPEDRGYLFLRWFLRTPLMRFVGRMLPGKIVRWIGNSMSSTSRRYTDGLREGLGGDETARREKMLMKVRSHVTGKLEAGNLFDIFIAGHIHEEIRESFKWREREILLVNLGSWLGASKPYGVYEESRGFEILDASELK